MFTIIGTTTLDVTLTAPDKTPGRRDDEFTPENLIFCKKPLTLLPGGNGANTAYVLGHLGASTMLCSAVGEDLPGRLLMEWLEEVDVDLSGVVTHPEKATSSTVIISDREYNRQAFHHHGASGSFGPEDLSQIKTQQCHTLLLTGYPLLSGWRSDETISILERAHARGIVTALDFGPAIGRPVILDELRPLLPHLDYLLCNAYEASVCARTDDLGASFQQLRSAGARTVVVKRGSDGAAYLGADARTFDVASGFSVDVKQTIGAGDSFNAGFLYARHYGYSLREAVQFANALAALIVASGRGVLGCPTRGQVGELLTERLRTE